MNMENGEKAGSSGVCSRELPASAHICEKRSKWRQNWEDIRSDAETQSQNKTNKQTKRKGRASSGWVVSATEGCREKRVGAENRHWCPKGPEGLWEGYFSRVVRVAVRWEDLKEVNMRPEMRNQATICSFPKLRKKHHLKREESLRMLVYRMSCSQTQREGPLEGQRLSMSVRNGILQRGKL